MTIIVGHQFPGVPVVVPSQSPIVHFRQDQKNFVVLSRRVGPIVTMIVPGSFLNGFRNHQPFDSVQVDFVIAGHRLSSDLYMPVIV